LAKAAGDVNALYDFYELVSGPASMPEPLFPIVTPKR
jgi:hypothetical protein